MCVVCMSERVCVCIFLWSFLSVWTSQARITGVLFPAFVVCFCMKEHYGQRSADFSTNAYREFIDIQVLKKCLTMIKVQRKKKRMDYVNNQHVNITWLQIWWPCTQTTEYWEWDSYPSLEKTLIWAWEIKKQRSKEFNFKFSSLKRYKSMI